MSYKIIKAEFWTDPKIKSLSLQERYLLFYYVTNPHSHFCGLYFLGTSTMADDTGLSPPDLQTSIDELTRQNLFRYDSVFSVAWVVNMLRHQILGWPSVSPKIIKAISNQLHKLHGCPLIKEFIDYYYEVQIPFEFPRGVPQIALPEAEEADANGTPASPTIAEQARQIFAYWKTVMNHPGADYSPNRQNKIQKILKRYSPEQVKQAIDNCKKSAFHMGENESGIVYDDIELICRNSEKFERFLNMSRPEARTEVGEAPKTYDQVTGKVLQLNRKTGEWEEALDQ